MTFHSQGNLKRCWLSVLWLPHIKPWLSGLWLSSVSAAHAAGACVPTILLRSLDFLLSQCFLQWLLTLRAHVTQLLSCWSGNAPRTLDLLLSSEGSPLHAASWSPLCWMVNKNDYRHLWVPAAAQSHVRHSEEKALRSSCLHFSQRH